MNKQMGMVQQNKLKIIIEVFNNIPENIKINKSKKKGVIIEKPYKIKAAKYDFNEYIRYEKFHHVLAYFYKTMEKNFSKYDINGFYENFKTLKIKERRLDLFEQIERRITGFVVQAEYDGMKNKIYIIKNTYTQLAAILCHELLHMATTKNTKKIKYSGLSQINLKTNKDIGRALNEGYTEYINQKYFLINFFDNGYDNEISIAKIIELIVGQEKMERLYFESDLYGLIEEISKYTEKENIMDIIIKFDKLHIKITKEENKKVEYQEIRKLLMEIYMTKQKMLLESGLITEEEYNKRRIVNGEVFVKENIVFSENAELTINHEKNEIEIIDEENDLLIKKANKYIESYENKRNYK